jgi:glycosyltransferase involved in cell wall biosynthesis
VTPLITVVIPSYKHGHLIGRALQSVIDQSYSNWEAIVVDNHSPDQTDQIVQGFNDPRITLLKIHNNGVIAASRNMGIKEARGDWIAFLDSDDWWDSKKLEKCLDYANDNFDVIYHKLKCYSINPLNEIKIDGEIECRDLAVNPYYSLFNEGPGLTTSAIVARRSSIISVNCFDDDANIAGGEDMDLWLRLAKIECRFKLVDSFLGFYLIGGVHLTAPDKSLRTIDYLQKKFCNSEFSSVPVWMHKSRIASYIKRKQYLLAVRYIVEMLRELPIYRTLLTLKRLIRSVYYDKFLNIKTIN